MSDKLKIAIIGGGASGLFAAIGAKSDKTSVTIYEKEKRVGRKILATGNGRCNMTNTMADIGDYHSKDVSFMKPVMGKFWVTDTLDMFEEMGILWKVEDEGKVYPYSDTASSVLDVLRRKVDSLGIKTVCEYHITAVKKQGKGFALVDSLGNVKHCDKVIIATGGKAGTQLGSDGGGYKLLKGVGHKITEIYPSLVQIKTETETVKKLKGIKVNAKVTLGSVSKTGEVLFADYGISGPPVFWLSSYIEDNKELTLDIMPEYSYSEVSEMITKRVKCLGETPLEEFFTGMLNKRVGQALMKHISIEPLSRPSNTLAANEIKALAAVIKGLKLKITGLASWNNAQVTKGGADVSQFDPNTMESKLAKGLYACGEVLDIDGDCGGYNLQWAWSSGYIAGLSAAGKE